MVSGNGALKLEEGAILGLTRLTRSVRKRERIWELEGYYGQENVNEEHSIRSCTYSCRMGAYIKEEEHTENR